MADVQFRIEAVGEWGDAETPAGQRQRPQFTAGWDDTVRLLKREVELLGGRQVVLAIDIDPRDVRKTDGLPAARARYGSFPGARVTFDSRHGTLVYGTDVYTAGGRYKPGQLNDDGFSRSGGRMVSMTGWQANVRAIALSLEALRAVDRHGVTRRGQQYAGFRALPPGGIALGGGGPRSEFATADDAARWLAEQVAVFSVDTSAGRLLTSPDELRRAWRVLARAAHPDTGGDSSQWLRLVAAKELIEQSHTSR